MFFIELQWVKRQEMGLGVNVDCHREGLFPAECPAGDQCSLLQIALK